jgi:hypothetical protein
LTVEVVEWEVKAMAAWVNGNTQCFKQLQVPARNERSRRWGWQRVGEEAKSVFAGVNKPDAVRDAGKPRDNSAFEQALDIQGYFVTFAPNFPDDRNQPAQSFVPLVNSVYVRVAINHIGTARFNDPTDVGVGESLTKGLNDWGCH